MIKQTLFELSFWHGMVYQIDNEKLKKHVLKNGNILSKDTTDSMHEDTSFPMHPELEKILVYIQSEFMYYHDNKYRLRLLKFWSQIHEKNQSTNIHNHVKVSNIEDSASLSGAYYVQCDEGAGYFVFDYPTDRYQYGRWKIKPQVGKYLLFPSTLEHWVSRNYSNNQRISISFDFKIEQNV